MMKKITAIFGVFLFLLALTPQAFAVTNSNTNTAISNINFSSLFLRSSFYTVMTGSEEVHPADPDGLGVTTVQTVASENKICVDIKTYFIDQPTAAHIHKAPKGVAGPVVIPLPTPDLNGVANGCVSADQSIINEIRNNPKNFYVNVHTNTYPEGAIRGQLF